MHDGNIEQSTSGAETGLVRSATDSDLHAIKDWLENEEAAGVEDNFLCNWEIIVKSHQRGELLVYVDKSSCIPVGFQLGRLLGPGILQVRHDMRGRGIGRKLVEHRINEARVSDEPFLVIQCKPHTSIPFWKKMGFTIFKNEHGKVCGHQALQKRHQIPPDGKPTQVTIRYYPEDRKWNETTAPYSTFTPTAVSMPNGTIFLSERVSIFKGIYPEARDIVVQIVLGEDQIYCDKAKYPDARELGVVHRSNGFFIDRIHLL
jgi:GNAT superfamily N-acetyltransferase